MALLVTYALGPGQLKKAFTQILVMKIEFFSFL